MHHNDAHACYALGRVHKVLDEKAPIYCHVTYVSDGAASNFKNRYQLYELCHSKYTSARWIFSATGHGKNACDGVGGLLKQQASLHNLRSESAASIQSAHEMVSQLSGDLKNVVLLHAPTAAIEEHRQQKSV